MSRLVGWNSCCALRSPYAVFHGVFDFPHGAMRDFRAIFVPDVLCPISWLQRKCIGTSREASRHQMRVQFSQSSWSHNFFLDFPRTTKPINTTSATMHFHHHRAHTQNHHHMPVRHITLCSRSEFMHSITSVLEMWKSKRRRTASATADKSRRKSKNNQAPAKKRSSRAKRTSNRIEKRIERRISF